MPERPSCILLKCLGQNENIQVNMNSIYLVRFSQKKYSLSTFLTLTYLANLKRDMNLREKMKYMNLKNLKKLTTNKRVEQSVTTFLNIERGLHYSR